MKNLLLTIFTILTISSFGQKVLRKPVKAIPHILDLEGHWVSDNTHKPKEFETLVATFDVKETMNDPKKGTRIILKPDGSGTETHALILSLTDGVLSLRRVLGDEVVGWLIRNVN
jgi:hypothetical protein